MYYTVYKTTNLINDKIYIGVHRTENLDDGYLGSGTYLNNAILKYGKENFSKDIIAICDTEEEMNTLEENLVNNTFITFFSTYNIKLGGNSSFGYLASKLGSLKIKEKFKSDLEFRNRISLKSRERANNLFLQGKILSKETRLKGVEASRSLGAILNKKMTFKKTNHAKGSKNSQFGTFWITNGVESKKCKEIIPDGWIRGRLI